MVNEIRTLCKLKGISIKKLEEDLGIGKNTVYKWDLYTPSINKISKVANYLGVDASEIMKDGSGISLLNNYVKVSPDVYPIESIVQIPLVGFVAAGYGCLAIENDYGETKGIEVASLCGYPPTECRALKVTGNSMYPSIVEGDIVIVHLQNDVDSGSIAVVLCEDGEATIKKIVKGDGYIELVPRNPEYKTKRYDETNGKDFRIYGKVLEMTRRF